MPDTLVNVTTQRRAIASCAIDEELQRALARRPGPFCRCGDETELVLGFG